MCQALNGVPRLINSHSEVSFGMVWCGWELVGSTVASLYLSWAPLLSSFSTTFAYLS